MAITKSIMFHYYGTTDLKYWNNVWHVNLWKMSHWVKDKFRYKRTWEFYIHSWNKRLLHPHLRQSNRYGSNCCVSSRMKLTWNVPVTAPQRNSTLPWLDFHFNALMPSRIFKVQNRRLGGHFALWQLRINNCMVFFSIITDCSNNAPSNPYRYYAWNPCTCSMRTCGKVLLLVAWVWLVLLSTASSEGMLPLELWCQASPRVLLGRPHLVKTVLCWGWSDRIAW